MRNDPREGQLAAQGPHGGSLTYWRSGYNAEKKICFQDLRLGEDVDFMTAHLAHPNTRLKVLEDSGVSLLYTRNGANTWGWEGRSNGDWRNFGDISLEIPSFTSKDWAFYEHMAHVYSKESDSIKMDDEPVDPTDTPLTEWRWYGDVTSLQFLLFDEILSNA